MKSQEFTYQLEATESASEGVIAALAALSELDSLSVDGWSTPTDAVPLYDAVDPDALDALFQGREDGGGATDHITFVYDDHNVTLDREGEITLTPMTTNTTLGDNE